jgi:hypothetical protein
MSDQDWKILEQHFQERGFRLQRGVRMILGKGRSRTFYGWMSIIPFVGTFMSLFLISLTDNAVVDKLDRLLEAVEKKA